MQILSPNPQDILQVYETVLERGSAIYCSTPITTGLVFAEWRAESGAAETDHNYAAALDYNVRRVNVQRARSIIQDLREKLRDPIIDPTSFPQLADWTKPTYLAMWQEVIRRYAHTVVMLPGWQYSAGCCVEYRTAIELGITCVSAAAQELNPKQAENWIDDAIKHYDKLGVNPSGLKSTLEQLRYRPGRLPE